jgi:ribosomal protein S18 acetylase RimI-like enzyme
MTRIRQAIEADLPVLASECGRSEGWVRRTRRRLRSADHEMLVAELDGRLVGCIRIRVEPRGAAAESGAFERLKKRLMGVGRPAGRDSILEPILTGRVDEILVAKERSGGDVSAALLRAGFDRLAQGRVDDVQAAIRSNDGETIELYRAVGFEAVRCILRRAL